MTRKEIGRMSDNTANYPKISTSVFSITEESNLAQLNIRFDISDASILSSIKSVLGLNLEMAPNTIVNDNEKFALWLGPDERLVILPKDQIITARMNLERELQGIHYSSVDLSSGQVVLDLKGEEVLNILSKGCSVDLHQKYFNVGQCVQTSIDKINAICFPLENNHIRIIVRRSYSKALIAWFKDASIEFV